MAKKKVNWKEHAEILADEDLTHVFGIGRYFFDIKNGHDITKCLFALSKRFYRVAEFEGLNHEIWHRPQRPVNMTGYVRVFNLGEGSHTFDKMLMALWNTNLASVANARRLESCGGVAASAGVYALLMLLAARSSIVGLSPFPAANGFDNAKELKKFMVEPLKFFKENKLPTLTSSCSRNYYNTMFLHDEFGEFWYVLGDVE